MQDLIQNHVSDLKKLRDVFHTELSATAEELSKAIAHYARRSDAALASFLEKASARGLEFEVSGTARLDQFCGPSASGGLPHVDDGPLMHTPTNADVARIAAAAERAVADCLHVESDGDRKPQPGRAMSRLNQGRPLEASHLQLQEGRIETAHSETASQLGRMS
jgi:hypothetical protein